MRPTERIRAFFKNQTVVRPAADMNDENLLEWLGISNTPLNKKSEVTYFTCLKVLAETLGKMPVKQYINNPELGKTYAPLNDTYNLLKTRPNPYMTPTIFLTAVENNRNHYGNGYIWIQRYFNRQKYGGEYGIKALYPMESTYTTVVVDDKGIFGNKGNIYYWYQDKYSGESYVFPSYDVIHVKTSHSFDGITGLPVSKILEATIEGGLESQNFSNNLYKNGLTAKAVLQYTGDLDDKLKKQLTEKYEKYTSGANNAGRIVPVPIGMKLEPLNIKLTDSQFFELKKYTALQIAAAFGIKPNQINDYEKSSYNGSEMQNLTFYVDTMLYILKQYEEEFNYKLLSPEEAQAGYYFKFNENAILRTDSQTQKDILCGYVNNAILTPNEARDKIDEARAEGGDVLMCNGNYVPITSVGMEDNE